MDQLKTLTSKFNIQPTVPIPVKEPVPVLLMYIQTDMIHMHALIQNDDKVDIQYVESHEIEKSLPKAIKVALTAYKKAFPSKRRPKLCILMEDYYLLTNRVTLSNAQMGHPVQQILLEIEELSEYEWNYIEAPQETKNHHVLLVYGLKKKLLKQIETEIRNNQQMARKAISRHHAFQELIKFGAIKCDPTTVNVIIDISRIRIRVYFILDKQIKMYRRCNLSLTEGKRLMSLRSIYKKVGTFFDSCIDSYIAKYSNQSINKIYLYSEVYRIPRQLDEFKIKGKTVQRMRLERSLIAKQKNRLRVVFPLMYGMYLDSIHRNKFNLIPVMKRVERFGYVLIAALFILSLINKKST